ncbi:MurR/RpiR family transcriptional regulator [Helcococcus kunzii]|uniref:MurR/RpiR family transcriptional regulator n=1 Tax=Helcococcus kunzii TaxID=40091 RepID=UPI001C9687B3|nr:MurR/RpiR family transcriptional regulator [Helcococcus kunzii]MCT1796118.1 MurR/RpiR family transcriptional regulator [Helcococcus kunzii]MCT1989484.1 MurR/RpiR family transcriptional regulator [Helcococcus kunzii]QZO76809.1 MurR/RpiR family transcriptional regulator [Helcococcus kunzii]
MKKVIYRLQTYYNNQATEVEKPVIRYILDNPREVISTDIHKLARLGFCSAATIVRICKKNGISGYKDLKLALMNELNFNDNLIKDSVKAKNATGAPEIVNEIFNENIKAINNTYNLIDYEVVDKVVNLMKKAKVIRLFAIGASYLVAKDLQQKFERINKFSVLYEDTHLQIVNSNNATKDDLAIIISYSGETKELTSMAKNIKSNGCKIVSITQYSNNKLMSMADYNLFVPQIEKSLRIGAGSSRISQLSVVDYLYHLYLEIEDKKYMEKIIQTNKLLQKN